MARLLQTVTGRRWRRIYTGATGVPLPADAPTIRSGAPDPDRVLVIGDGAASGWGVPTYELALGGRLAAALERRTSRPCDVDHLGDDAMNVATAVDWLGERPLDRYDAVVVALGLSDAVRQTPVVQWRAGLELLLHRVLQRVRPAVDVVVVGVQPVEAAPAFGGTLGRLGQLRADRLNAATQRLTAETARVEYVPLPSAEAPVPGDVEWTYLYWAEYLSAFVAPLLGRARAASDRVPGVVTDAPSDGWARPARESPRLQELLAGARDELGGEFAWLGLLTDEREVIATSTTGRAPFSVPLELSFCRFVAETDEVVVVPDVAADPRFASNPLLELLRLGSYVGHPLRDDAGRVVGTICVASTRPRPAFAGTGPALERYAHEAEAELARLAVLPAPGAAAAD